VICSKVNRALFEKLVVFAFDAYNNVKTGTLSGWSWPSWHLATLASAAFIASDTPFPDYTPSFADV